MNCDLDAARAMAGDGARKIIFPGNRGLSGIVGVIGRSLPRYRLMPQHMRGNAGEQPVEMQGSTKK